MSFPRIISLRTSVRQKLVPNRLVLYSAWGRLIAAWSFLRLGWYCFGLGGLMVGAYASCKCQMADWSRTLVLLCLPLGALVIILIPPAIGQHYYKAGNLSATLGHNQEAIIDFRKAMRWDSWHAHDIDLYAAIGQMQKQTGSSFDSPERHIHRAVDLRDANEYEAAVFEFSRAVDAAGHWPRRPARKRP